MAQCLFSGSPAASARGQDGSRGECRGSSQGNAAGGASCGGQAGGSLPSCVGKCDSELWELGLESFQGGMSGEAAESVTPLSVLVMAALRLRSVLKGGAKGTTRVASRAANRETGSDDPGTGSTYWSHRDALSRRRPGRWGVGECCEGDSHPGPAADLRCDLQQIACFWLRPHLGSCGWGRGAGPPGSERPVRPVHAGAWCQNPGEMLKPKLGRGRWFVCPRRAEPAVCLDLGERIPGSDHLHICRCVCEVRRHPEVIQYQGCSCNLLTASPHR